MTIDLDELERLEKAATPAPWRGGVFRMQESVFSVVCTARNERTALANAELGAAARNALPALLAELKSLRNVVHGYPTKSDGKPLSDARLRWILERNKPGSRVEFPLEDLAAAASELRELRAYKQQVERVKTCDDAHCFGGVRMEMNGGDAGSVGACAACGGLPE